MIRAALPDLRAIGECPGYSASADGRIFSHWHRSGFGFAIDMNRPPRELRQFDRRTLRNKESPYLSVNATRNGKRCNRFVHELVLIAWVGPRPGSPNEIEACHGEGGSRDNRLANLRWDTTKANAADRIRAQWERDHASGGVAEGSGEEEAGELAGAFDGLGLELEEASP